MAKLVTTAQLAEKLDGLADNVGRLVTALTAQSLAPEAEAVTPAAQAKPEVDPAYLAHQSTKAAEHATNKGEEVVLYTRRNKAGECKVAYALRSRYDEVVSKQPSCIGPVGSFQP